MFLRTFEKKKITVSNYDIDNNENMKRHGILFRTQSELLCVEGPTVEKLIY